MSHPLRKPAAASNGKFDASAATNAVVTLAATANNFWVISTGVIWSYSAAPTGGRLTVAVNGAVVVDIDITAAGPGFLPLPEIRTPGVNQQVVVTLYSGGGSVVGKVSLVSAWLETNTVPPG